MQLGTFILCNKHQTASVKSDFGSVTGPRKPPRSFLQLASLYQIRLPVQKMPESTG